MNIKLLGGLWDVVCRLASMVILLAETYRTPSYLLESERPLLTSYPYFLLGDMVNSNVVFYMYSSCYVMMSSIYSYPFSVI